MLCYNILKLWTYITFTRRISLVLFSSYQMIGAEGLDISLQHSPDSMPHVSSNNRSISNAVCPAMVNPAILAQDRYADYKSGLSNDPPLVAGKPSLRDVLDLPEYRSVKERALGFLRIPRVEAGPFSLECLGRLWRRMISVSRGGFN